MSSQHRERLFASGLPRRRAPRARVGLTLVELLVAVGLVAFVFAAVVQVLDRTLGIWQKTETRRELIDEGAGVLELLARDLSLADAGPRGDLLCEWVGFDTDGDGSRETVYPRLVLVRRASPAEFSQLAARRLAAESLGLLGDLEATAADSDPDSAPDSAPDSTGAGAGSDAAPRTGSAAVTATELAAVATRADDATLVRSVPENEGLLEVSWALLPAYSGAQTREDTGRRAEGLLWRGERIYGSAGLSMLDGAFFRSDGRPPADALEEVTGGILWLGFNFASELTVLPSAMAGEALDTWSVGDLLGEAGTAWDAWGRQRPDLESSSLNAIPAGARVASERAMLPRRVRLELEIERAGDRKRRARLTAAVAPNDVVMLVSDGDRLPRPLSRTSGAAAGRATGAGQQQEPRYIKIDAEWMLLLQVNGNRATVRRGQRGTLVSGHSPGALVHHGFALVREVPIATRGDWNL